MLTRLLTGLYDFFFGLDPQHVLCRYIHLYRDMDIFLMAFDFGIGPHKLYAENRISY